MTPFSDLLEQAVDRLLREQLEEWKHQVRMDCNVGLYGTPVGPFLQECEGWEWGLVGVRC